MHMPTLLVLENASIHKARIIKAQLTNWADRKLTLLFSPPHAPEHNRIDFLWRLYKHYWLTPEYYQKP